MAGSVLLCAGTLRCLVEALHRSRVQYRLDNITTRDMADGAAAAAAAVPRRVAVPGVPRFVLRRVPPNVPAPTVARWWALWVVATGVVAAGLATHASSIAALALLLGLVGASWRVLGALSGWQSRRIEAGLPLVAETVARGLRSGLSLIAAMADAADQLGGPIGRELHQVAAVARLAGTDRALGWWMEHRPGPSVHLLAASLRLGSHTGGAPAHALDAVGETLRDRLGVAAEARALAAQAKASAAVMLGAPVVFCVLLVLSDASASQFLLRSRLGLGCLGLGAGLDAIGAVWMRRILGRVAP